MAVEFNLNGLGIVEKQIREAADRGIENAADMIVQLAKELAPEDTGALKLSIKVEQTLGKQEMQRIISAGDGTGDLRGIVQEFGSIYMPPQPYLIPAAHEIDITLEVYKEVRKVL